MLFYAFYYFDQLGVWSGDFPTAPSSALYTFHQLREQALRYKAKDLTFKKAKAKDSSTKAKELSIKAKA